MPPNVPVEGPFHSSGGTARLKTLSSVKSSTRNVHALHINPVVGIKIMNAVAGLTLPNFRHKMIENFLARLGIELINN